jgi:hypothetical protein
MGYRKTRFSKGHYQKYLLSYIPILFLHYRRHNERKTGKYYNWCAGMDERYPEIGHLCSGV